MGPGLLRFARNDGKPLHRDEPGDDEELAVSLMNDSRSHPTPNPLAAGIKGRCPRCGEGKLFAGFLGLAPRCERCSLDYGFIDAGDGPAVFVILFAGLIVVAAALVVEVVYEPPFWLHAVLWGPLILVVTLAPLRIVKGLLVALQYRNKAAEGRLEIREQP
jgi:uncharacterized protein (DUF983 family)